MCIKAESITSIIVIFIILLLAGLLAGLLALDILYPNGLNGGSSSNYISVTASGSAVGYPQQAVVYINVNGSGSTGQIATAKLSQELAQLNQTLLKYSSSNMIQTDSYSLILPYNSTNYTATEGIQVQINNISNVSPLLGSLSIIKNLYITDVNSQLTDNQTASLRTIALNKAMANATSQA